MEDLDQVRARLREREAQLMSELNAAREQVARQPFQQISGEVPDAGDASVADTELDLVNAARERDSEELREVRAALQRIEAGTYGLCIVCGDPIEPERLQAVPTARRDLRHEEESERQRGGVETPRL